MKLFWEEWIWKSGLKLAPRLFDFRTKLIHFLSIYSANEFFSVWQVLPANHSSRLAQYTFTQKIIFDSLLLILQMWRMIITKWLLVGGTPCKMIHSSTIWTRISLRYRGCHLMMTHFTQLMWTKEIPGELFKVTIMMKWSQCSVQ